MLKSDNKMTDINPNIFNEMGGFSRFSGIIDHFSFDEKNCKLDFSKDVRNSLKELSRKTKKTRMPCCMFPGCKKTHPTYQLDFHHFKPKEYGGKGSFANALLLCRDHHTVVQRLCFFPIDAYFMQKGIWHPSVDRLRTKSLKEIWEKLYSLYGFPDFTNESDVMLRFAEVARIRQAVFDRDTEHFDLWAKIMGWSANILSQPLVVIFKSKAFYQQKKGHPKNFIQMLLKDAEKYVKYANDPLLTCMNHHLTAINLNALGSFNAARYTALHSEKTLDQAYETSMPIDIDSYKYYIRSQNAVILAKKGDLRGLALSRKSLNFSFDKTPDQYIESICRHLQTALLLGNYEECKSSEALLICSPNAKNPDKELQKLKTLAYLRFCQNDIQREFEYFASEARNMAIKFNRFHTLGKIEAIMKAADNNNFLTRNCFIKGKRLSKTNPVLASLM